MFVISGRNSYFYQCSYYINTTVIIICLLISVIPALFINPFIPLIYSLIYSVLHPFIHPSIHQSLHPSIHPLFHSIVHPFIHNFFFFRLTLHKKAHTLSDIYNLTLVTISQYRQILVERKAYFHQ